MRKIHSLFKIKKLKNDFVTIKFIFCLSLSLFYAFEKNLLIFNLYIPPTNYTIEEKKALSEFSKYKNKPLNNNDISVIEEKKNILNYMSKTGGRNIKSGNKIFYTAHSKFGNLIVNLNKIIFFSEIIGNNHIILDKDIFWFIKNKIYIEKYNMTIEVDDILKYNNSLSSNVGYYECDIFFYSFFTFKPEIRINYIRDEILRNLPKINTSVDELYIHVRSGDIFSSCPHYPYAQPPLCFYLKVLNYTNFRKVFLLSEKNNNPIIKKLIRKRPNIIYKKNALDIDIAYLTYAYNIVSSISSFLISIIQLNYNLQNLFEYNIYQNMEKMRHLHYDRYKFPHNNFTILRMEPSPIYKKVMYIWKNRRKQRNLMIKEKCLNDFKIIKKQN